MKSKYVLDYHVTAANHCWIDSTLGGYVERKSDGSYYLGSEMDLALRHRARAVGKALDRCMKAQQDILMQAKLHEEGFGYSLLPSDADKLASILMERARDMQSGQGDLLQVIWGLMTTLRGLSRNGGRHILLGFADSSIESNSECTRRVLKNTAAAYRSILKASIYATVGGMTLTLYDVRIGADADESEA